MGNETQHWSVSVSRNGNNLVTIESNMLAGQPEFSDEDARVIRGCAEHLLAFIGPAAAPVGEPAPMPTEMPKVKPGDWVRLSGFGWTPVSKDREAELLTGNDGVEEIKRLTVIWQRADRKEPTA